MKREKKYSVIFAKKINKLRGNELKNLYNKCDEILESTNIYRYKNLRNNLKKYKRVHVNGCYVILFFGKDNKVYFVDYDHHDKIYKTSLETLKKYDALEYI